jgi:hypothetical protein
MNAPPVISSIGPPPERHCDRVVAAMVRWLAAESDRLMPRVEALLAKEGPPPGSARGQQRFAMRIAKAADKTILGIRLKPGKRGRFKLVINIWGTLYEATEKPQIVLGSLMVEGIGHHCIEPSYRRLLIVSHHALSRLAQRCEVRTVRDLHYALGALGEAVMAEPELLNADIPPAGRRLNLAGGIAVLRRDPDTGDLIVATVLESKEEESDG